MPKPNPHVGAVGLPIRVQARDQDGAVLAVSDASVKRIHIRPPGGPKVERDAAFVTDGSDGLIEYKTVAGDLPVPGVYQIQGFFVTPSWQDHTEPGTMTVDQPF